MKQNLVGKILGKIKIFVQDFVPIKTVLNVKIQLWNLGFVEAHQNSILRGQGFLSTRGGWKGHAAFPHHQLARKQNRRQKSAVHEQRQKKAVKRSSTVVAVFKCDRFFVWAHRDRDERRVGRNPIPPQQQQEGR